jgi:hypothetical protein
MNNIVEYASPFNNIQKLCEAIHIIKSSRFLDSDQMVQIINKFTNVKLTSTQLFHFMEKIDLYSIYPSGFFSNLKNFDAKVHEYLTDNRLPVMILQCDFTRCVQCNKQMTEKKVYESMIYYCSKPPQRCIQVALQCSCKLFHFYSFNRKDIGKKQITKTFYENCLEQEFICFTPMTVFETKIFKMVLADLVFKNSTFIGFIQSYNMVNSEFQNGQNTREELCIKRLIEGFFYYNILVIHKRNGSLSSLNAPCMENLDVAINDIKSCLLKSFVEKWTGSYHAENCRHKDCSKSLNVDGLWKVIT